MTVKEHYDNHLGKFYSWMLGDFETKVIEQQKYFKSHNIQLVTNGVALDLGCGNGIQSVSLARSGFKVIAIDFSEQLLYELNKKSIGLDIKTIEADFMDFSIIPYSSFEIITCMGDTITHLLSSSEIEKLFQKSYGLLVPGGKLIISYRDLTVPLEGVSRFLPVKSDENRILTCFLEYFDNFVLVYDLLHEKENGEWIQKISAYKKLRVSENEIITILKNCGFEIDSSETINRMVHIVAKKTEDIR